MYNVSILKGDIYHGFMTIQAKELEVMDDDTGVLACDVGHRAAGRLDPNGRL